MWYVPLFWLAQSIILLWFAFLQHSMEKHTVSLISVPHSLDWIFFSLNKPTNQSMHYFVVDKFAPACSLSQGCAFIKYVDSACAERAIKQLHGKVSKWWVHLEAYYGSYFEFSSRRFVKGGCRGVLSKFSANSAKISCTNFSVTILKVRVVNGWLTHGDFWEVGWELQFKNSTMAWLFAARVLSWFMFSSQETFLSVLGYKGEISYHELGISPFCLFVFFFFLSHRVVQYWYYHNSFPFFFPQGMDYVISFNILHRFFETIFFFRLLVVCQWK